jgi:hypothetical protein
MPIINQAIELEYLRALSVQSPRAQLLRVDFPIRLSPRQLLRRKEGYRRVTFRIEFILVLKRDFDLPLFPLLLDLRVYFARIVVRVISLIIIFVIPRIVAAIKSKWLVGRAAPA